MSNAAVISSHTRLWPVPVSATLYCSKGLLFTRS